jgi:hypothetical protein
MRGIVYPKWVKYQNEITQDEQSKFRTETNNIRKINWKIKNYAFSFSKHFSKPKIKINNEPNNYNNKHLQNCSYKIINKFKNEPIKVYPPF